MSSGLEKLEDNITDFWTEIFKSTLFFLTNTQKSIVVSIIHYIVFVFGFYYFFFKSEPRSLFRVAFFIFVALGALSYFLFHKCFFTSIEFSLSNKKNFIQKFFDRYFGKETEDNVISKIVLSIGTLISGFILLKDYGIIKFNN
jgi:hypothetical protein